MKLKSTLELARVLESIRANNYSNLLLNAQLYLGSGFQYAFTETLRVDIDKSTYINNVQRILDQMDYDKIEAYKNLIFCKLTDGLLVVNHRDFTIADDTGTCNELAVKTATWLQLMYPENQYIVAEDKRRPSGWNHFYVFDFTHQLVIDPTKNKIGLLSDTGKWDKTNICYRMDTASNIFQYLDESSISDMTTGLVANFYTSTGSASLPLIGPRHFDSKSNITPFGVTLNIYGASQCPFLSVKTYDGRKTECPIYKGIDADDVYGAFQQKNVDMPLDVITRITNMWNIVCEKGNCFGTKMTIAEMIELRKTQNLDTNFKIVS